ncbi:hypothetical protein CTI12_AA449230 [Artemisia annua]|uniref:Uncharacterized protein n=1 Tax=Artemisia annua TaxID=35608 RepID=A0A2U1LUX1_ARTAN|nr:hypothetical protein CTI12_AA449230 [Artemisia annua]
MTSLGAFRISCPLQGHEGCSGGHEKGFSKKYFIDHLGTRHFKTDALKASHKTRIASDFSLFTTLDQALHQAGIWLCGECFRTHTFSKNCKHAVGDMVHAPRYDEVAIYGIPVPLRPTLNAVEERVAGESVGIPTVDRVIEGVATGMPSLDVEPTYDLTLLDRVFAKKLRTVKCIPPRARLGFAKLFRGMLDKVLACPGDLSAWVQLLILPACVLTAFVPTNRAQRRSGERERCQLDSISRAILRWRDPVDRLSLVMDRLAEVPPSAKGVTKLKDQDGINLGQCKRKLGDGHFTAAIKTQYVDGLL